MYADLDTDILTCIRTLRRTYTSERIFVSTYVHPSMHTEQLHLISAYVHVSNTWYVREVTNHVGFFWFCGCITCRDNSFFMYLSLTVALVFWTQMQTQTLSISL